MFNQTSLVTTGFIIGLVQEKAAGIGAILAPTALGYKAEKIARRIDKTTLANRLGIWLDS